MPDTIRVDVSEVRAVLQKFRNAGSKGMVTALNKGLRKGGDIVANAGRANAAWSSRIPGTIKTNVSPKTVRVSAGGAGAPHAYYYEGSGHGGSFRHPVYGHRKVWVSQQCRPFLTPALEQNTDRVAHEIETAVNEVLDNLFD
jgi:hypothetical protein